MNTYQPFAAVSQLPAALRLPEKNTPLDFWSMYIVNLVDFHGFEPPLVFLFQKVGNLVK